MEIKNELTTKYWIVYNEDKSVIHYGKTEVGEITTSGQPLSEIFNNEQEYKNRLIELNINIE
jgi:hypothetical protein